LGGVFSDNLFLTENSPVSDLTLVELVGLGYRSPSGKNSTLSLDYAITGSQYLDHSQLDGVNQAAVGKGTLLLDKTNITLSLNYERLSNASQGHFLRATDETQNLSSAANQQAVQFSQRQNLNGRLSVSRDLAPKTVFTGSLAYYGSFYDESNFRSTQNIYSQAGLGYRITGKSTVGLAGAFGYLKTEDSTNQSYQNALLTADYDATGKLVVTAQGGMRFNQYENSGGSPSASPETSQFVFNLQARYQMRPKTALELFGFSTNGGSATVPGVVLKTTQAGLTLKQGIADRFALEVTGGLENIDYNQAIDLDSTKRSDNYWNGAVRFSFQPTPKSSLGIYYNYLMNDSNRNGTSYESNRFGFQAAITY
jgi:hypothetical protein